MLPAFSSWDKKFIIDRDSFDSGLPDDNADIPCFSDGSKNAELHTGCGLAIYLKNVDRAHQE